MIQLFACSSLILAVPAAIVLTERLIGRTSSVLSLLVGTVLYACLLIVPVHAEAALEIVGVVDRVWLLGPAVASVFVLATFRGPDAVPALMALRKRRNTLFRTRAELPKDLSCAVVAIALIYGFFALERALAYPIAWDSVSYHLPVAASWLKSGSLGLPPEAHFYEAVTWNGDVPGLLALATGWVALGELWNLVSLAMVLSAAYVLGRSIGLERYDAGVTTLLVATIPMVLYLTFSAYVDLLVAGGLVGSLALVLSFHHLDSSDSSDRGVLFVAGLACGLAVGTKPTAWPLAGMISLVAVYLVSKRPVVASDRIRLTALFAAGVVLPSLFWFMRNGIATGNPAFPMEIGIFGHRLFAGTAVADITYDPAELDLLDQLHYWLPAPWTDGKGVSGYPYNPGSGLGPVFATFVVPGLVYLAWRFRRLRRLWRLKPPRWRLRALVAVLLVLTWLSWWYVLTPVWRYGLAGLVLACVLSGPLVGDLRRTFPRWFKWTFLAAIVLFAAVAAVPRAQSLAHQVRHGEWSWNEYYHVPAAYAHIPGHAKVANVDVTREGWNNFELLGPELSRRVVPDWKTREVLERGTPPWSCGWHVVDRAPFQLEPAERDASGKGVLRLLAEVPAMHGKERWRIWYGDGDGCDSP